MDKIALLPPEVLQARLGLINKELNSIPRLTMGKHRGVSIVRENRYEDGVRIKSEYSISSPHGRELLALSKRRSDLLSLKKVLDQLVVPSSSFIDPGMIDTYFDKSFWEHLRSCGVDGYEEGRYEHNGMKLRSRGEVVIAQVLDSLGLEYKYEPSIIIGDYRYNPDFAVYLPEFERCFFIEFLGMLDKYDYAAKNSSKIYSYMSSGMVINRDLLLFYGTQNSMPSVEDIVEDIVALISKWCRMYSVCDT